MFVCISYSTVKQSIYETFKNYLIVLTVERSNKSLWTVIKLVNYVVRQRDCLLIYISFMEPFIWAKLTISMSPILNESSDQRLQGLVFRFQSSLFTFLLRKVKNLEERMSLVSSLTRYFGKKREGRAGRCCCPAAGKRSSYSGSNELKLGLAGSSIDFVSSFESTL